jgi:hypothetical protein
MFQTFELVYISLIFLKGYYNVFYLRLKCKNFIKDSNFLFFLITSNYEQTDKLQKDAGKKMKRELVFFFFPWKEVSRGY